MKIAFDTFDISGTLSSGSMTYTVSLIQALAGLATGDEWQMITHWRKKRECGAAIGRYPGAVVKNAYPHHLLLGKELRFIVEAAMPFFQRRVGRRCDLFHCTNQNYFPLHIPSVVTTIHDLIPLRKEPWVSEKAKAEFRGRIGPIIRKSILLFTDSAFSKAEIGERFPFASDKTIVIPLAAHPMFTVVQSDRSFMARYGIRDAGRPYLLYVGQIQDRKNVLSMLQAFESLAPRFPDFYFIIVGQISKTPYTDDLFAYHATSPFRDRILFIHDVTNEDLVNFYNHARGMVYYSFIEGFGLPIVEAMACGCPVAASKTSSMTEIAEDAAIMVDPRDFDSMRDGMLRLLDDQSLRNELRAKGFERARRFSWKKTAELTYEGYKQALRRLP